MNEKYYIALIITLFVVILPIFDYLEKLFNKDFTNLRKLILSLTLITVTFIFTYLNNFIKINFYLYLLLLFIIFLIFFILNRKPYVNLNSNKLIEISKSKNPFTILYNKISARRNKKIMVNINKEQTIISNFVELDVFSIYLISLMLSDIKSKTLEFNFENFNLNNLIMSFCKDVENITLINDLNNFYDNKYFTFKIDDYLNELKQNIYKILKKEFKHHKDVYNEELNKVLPLINDFTNIKLYNYYFDKKNNIINKERYKLSKLEKSTKKEITYLIDLLSTCTCISKIIYMNKLTNSIDTNHEFYRIIYNMSCSIKNIELIINKTRPIYDEFYKESLGSINDDILYSIYIIILYYDIINPELTEKEEEILDLPSTKIIKEEELDNYIKQWLFTISDEYKELNIERFIVIKIINSTDLSNYELLFNILSKLEEYVKFYNYNLSHNIKKDNKDRYLKGDFTKEFKEIDARYSLTNIKTGTEFELYLTKLFKELGYEVKHNGKSGDQGADVILKKNDYIYVLQAKFYREKLNNEPVQEIVGAIKYYNANQGVVATNSIFTKGAKDLAKANNVILIDGKILNKLVDYTYTNNKEKYEDVLQKLK